MSIYDASIWIFRSFFRREGYLKERLKVMKRDLRMQWPFQDSCFSHINEAENERLMKGNQLGYFFFNETIAFI